MMRIEPISDAQGGTTTIAPVAHIVKTQHVGIAPEHQAQMQRRAREETTAQHIDEHDERTTAALRKLERALRESNIRLEFTRNDKTGGIILKLIDDKTGDILQQFPSEVSQRLAEVLGGLQGHVFNRKA